MKVNYLQRKSWVPVVDEGMEVGVKNGEGRGCFLLSVVSLCTGEMRLKQEIVWYWCGVT